MATARPTLSGAGVTVRPGKDDDLDELVRILTEPSVAEWWGVSETRDDVAKKLLEERGEYDEVLLVIEADGHIAGGIEYYENVDPDYRYAGIDIYLGDGRQGKGLGSEAVRLVAQWLFDDRGHHRLIIDPAVTNERAIAAYKKVGFQPVGVMRQYEKGRDGSWHDGLLMDLLKDELTE